MRASRLLSIMILLQLRARLTADALAEEFEVSVRTIYRDIDELSAAGVPVYGDRGPGGGFQLLEGYRTKLTGLSSDEAEAMMLIGLPGPASELGLGSAAARASKKLMASLPQAFGEGAGRIASRFHLDTVDWYRSAEPVRFLPALTRAVLDQQRVVINYESWSGIRSWKLDPLGLVLKAGSWYLAASTGKRVQTFRISNILELTIDAATFERPKNFELENYWNESLKRFEEQLRPLTANLIVSKLGKKRIAELGAFGRQAAEQAHPTEDPEWFKLMLPIENVEHAARTLAAIGSEFRVEGPEELRLELRKLAQQLATRCAAALHKSAKRGKTRVNTPTS